MEKNKTNILCTRPLEDALVSEADAHGVAIDVLPFIETRMIENETLKQQIRKIADQPETVVFTSMNAVDAVISNLTGVVPTWEIYCIGTTTSKLVADYFGEKAIAGKANDAAGLAELIIEDRFIDDVTFFCGASRRDELPAMLRHHQVDVDEIYVYETTAIPHKISKNYEGILFFSPSAVSSFFTNNTVTGQGILFAIGSTTADEIKKHSNNKIIISDEPGKENLVNKMMKYFSDRSLTIHN